MSAVGNLDAFEDRIRDREVGSDATVTDYIRWIERFESWRPAEEPGEGQLRDFDSYLADDERPTYPWEGTRSRGPSPPPAYAYQTRVKALSAAKLWLKHEYDTEVDTEVQNIAKGEPTDFDPTILNETEIEQVKRDSDIACDNTDCPAAIIIGYDAIMRGAEVADARWEDVDLVEGTIYVRAKKGSETAHIELSDEAMGALRDHMATTEERKFLFHNAHDKPWTASAWNTHFRRQHHEAGFHSFARHSAVTNRLRNGEDFGSVYLRARHASPQTTIKYANIIGEDVPDWTNQL